MKHIYLVFTLNPATGLPDILGFAATPKEAEQVKEAAEKQNYKIFCEVEVPQRIDRIQQHLRSHANNYDVKIENVVISNRYQSFKEYKENHLQKDGEDLFKIKKLPVGERITFEMIMSEDE